MSKLKKLTLGLILGTSLLGIPLCSQANVTVNGQVRTPVNVTYAPGMRLLDIISKAQPNPDNYWLAAAWMHQPLVEQQTRLKVGVLFDLKMLQRGALLNNNEDLAFLASKLHEYVNLLPVTGRKVANLDPVALEVNFAHNYLVNDTDRVVYQPRTDRVNVIGAVIESCRLPYQPMQEAREYLEQCPQLKEADTEFLWLISPRGTYEHIPIAAWNRKDGVYAVAGSTILVPIRNKNPDLPTPDLNEQLAQFLATQLLVEVAP